jgi:hypothetical protein
LKQTADTLEGKHIKKLADYDAASIDAQEPNKALFALLHDNDLHEIRFSFQGYQNLIGARIKVLPPTPIRENEKKCVYLAAEEKDVAARNKQREKLRAINGHFNDE